MPQYRKSSVLYDAHAPPLRGKEAPSPSIVIPTTPDDFFEASHELHQSGERRRAIAMLKKISEPLLRKPREQLSQEDSRLVMKACIRLMGIAQEDPIGDVEGLQEAVEAAATLVDLKVSPSTLGYLGWAQYLQACESSNPRVRETLCRGSLEAMRHALRLPAASSSQPLSTSSTNHPNSTTSNTSNKENTQKSTTQLVLRAAFVLAYNGFPFDAVEVLESAVSTKQLQHQQHGDADALPTTETTNMSSELLLLGALHLSLDQTDAATSIFDRLCTDVPSTPHGRLAEFMRVLCVLNYSGGTNRALVDYQIRGLLLKLSNSQGGGGENNNEGGGGADLPSSSHPAGLEASGLRDDPEYESTSTLPPNNNSTTSLPPPLSPSHTIGMLLTAARISGLAGSFNTALFAVDAATRIVEAEAASAAPTTTISGDSGPPMLAMEPSCMSSSPILLKIAAAVAAEKGRICTWKANASVSEDDKASLFEAASIQFQAALNLHRYNYEALLGRAAAMRDHGVDMPEAIVEYRKLFGLFPRSVEAVGGLVSCCRAAGQGKVPVSDHIEGVPRSSPTSEYVSIPSLAVYASKLSRRHSKGQVIPLEWIMWAL